MRVVGSETAADSFCCVLRGLICATLASCSYGYCSYVLRFSSLGWCDEAQWRVFLGVMIFKFRHAEGYGLLIFQKHKKMMNSNNIPHKINFFFSLPTNRMETLSGCLPETQKQIIN